MISPCKVIEKVFALGRKYKDGGNDLMQKLVKLFMNSLYGVQIRRDINECKVNLKIGWKQKPMTMY